MKKPTNPSKVIIIPQTPQNNNQQAQAPQGSTPAEKQESTPAQQKVEGEKAEEKAE